MQAPGRFRRIRRVIDRANDGDGWRTRVNDGADIIQVDATDREEWPIDNRGDAGHERRAHGGTALLRRSWKDGSDRNVVDALVDSELRLGETVRGTADQSSFKPRKGSHHLRWKIVLTEVNPICVGRDRKSRIIVNDE